MITWIYGKCQCSGFLICSYLSRRKPVIYFMYQENHENWLHRMKHWFATFTETQAVQTMETQWFPTALKKHVSNIFLVLSKSLQNNQMNIPVQNSHITQIDTCSCGYEIFPLFSWCSITFFYLMKLNLKVKHFQDKSIHKCINVRSI